MSNQVITGHCPELIKAMQKAGILPDQCKRVVIDIGFDDIVTIYYECYADKRLLEIDFAECLSPLIKLKVEEPTNG